MWPYPAVRQTVATSTFIKYRPTLGKAPGFPIHFALSHTHTQAPRTQHGVVSKMSAPSLFERCSSAFLTFLTWNSSRQKHLFEMQHMIKRHIRSKAAQWETFFSPTFCSACKTHDPERSKQWIYTFPLDRFRWFSAVINSAQLHKYHCGE